MTHVIRIDPDVWAWLQKNARPLEDTPNSVLRRIAGLDEQKSEPSRGARANSRSPRGPGLRAVSRIPGLRAKQRTNSGQRLKEEWEIPARHVLYHKDGNYYNHLHRFPGALCDPDGYVLFKTEQEYKKSPYLQHGQQLHVPNGISSMPGYVRVK